MLARSAFVVLGAIFFASIMTLTGSSFVVGLWCIAMAIGLLATIHSTACQRALVLVLVSLMAAALAGYGRSRDTRQG
jgi:steroid 5-alpha reductase family enzyme